MRTSTRRELQKLLDLINRQVMNREFFSLDDLCGELDAWAKDWLTIRQEAHESMGNRSSDTEATGVPQEIGV